ncbi:phd-finger domain-containing protein [Ophiostoma piceae UAMH 11346]|uniref:Phd-finger domain-containing protein n=1 Tax=Ophiostoma piceae (strain UAMH 11346) TaxID=1262450 RepID=S3CBZ9_OPHP1|nr:phd-finger domain-containing protein [Ophiostoma piceae UAMH 11346]
MKTAKPSATASDAAPNRRAQPVRLTRTNPPRLSATSGRGAGRDRDGAAGAAQEQPIDIFPGVTHFADAISALPKELVKHFTLLKEVDAKIHVPQQALFQLINTALRQPIPNTTRSPYDGSTAAASAPASVPMTAQNSNSRAPSAAANGHPAQTPAVGTEVATASAFDPSNLPRRHLFRQVAIEIREMLVALEEKNHVISTANDALNKQMGRIDDVWPHLELEFSEEAKWGSDTHWAYPENRAASRATNNAQQAERSRREGAANLSAAAQQIAEEAAARSDARKQAVAARRSQKAAQQANHHDSDADDLHHKAEARKQGAGTKSRKPPSDPAAAAAGVGLGILSGAAGAAGAVTTAPKRRKVEKPAPTSAPMERALSGVYGSAAGTSSKGRTSSPRESPAPDGGKKRKALPSGGNAAKKSRNTASATSSPVVGAFPDPVKNARASPAPSSLGLHTSESLSRGASQSGAYNGPAIPTTPSLIPTTEVPAKKVTDTDKETPGAKKLGSGDKVSHIPVIGGTTTSSADTASGAGISSGLTAAVMPNTAAGNATGSSAAANTGSSHVANATTGAANPKAVAPATSTPVVASLENKISDKDVSTSTASGPSGAQALVVSPTVEDQSEAQLKAENSKQRPSPLAPAAEAKLKTGTSAAPSSSSNTGIHTHPRAPVDKPNKVSPVPTPVPVPAPASSHPPAAIASPAKVQVLKVEATEASSSVSAVPMTRTRSAGGAKKEAAPASAPAAPSSAAPATPTTSSASNTKPSTEAATPVGRPTSSAAAPASSAATKKESTPLSIKWYCDDCKKRLKVGERKLNGR